MFISIVTATLIGTLVLFVLAAGSLFYQLAREAQREKTPAAHWLTQTAWTAVPVVIVSGLLLLASLLAHPGSPAPVSASSGSASTATKP